jgi:uncharacterized membrane protein
VIAVLALALVNSVPMSGGATNGQHVEFAEVHSVIAQRCTQCHASHPTDDMFREPPNGVKLETPQEIASLVDKIKLRVIDTETMPFANKTRMTESERKLIANWIAEGAPLD